MKKIVVILTLSILLIYYFYPEEKLPVGAKITSIVVLKSARQMQVFSSEKLLKTYKISLGRQPVGAKRFERDRKTPEGIYTINNKNPNSGYHKNLGMSYPNKDNVKFAKTHNKSAGGDIKIHGIKNKFGFIGKFHRWFDWTEGCIAITNKEIDELYNTVIIGAQIKIKA